MPNPRLDPIIAEQAYAAFVSSGGSKAVAARDLGIPLPTFQHRLKRYWEYKSANDSSTPGFSVPPLPSPELTPEELVENATQRFERKRRASDARKCIEVRINEQKPIGIMWMGDPHVDDDGCDWTTLRRDIALCRDTEGLYAANLGDTTNNWVGRLARLYAHQEATETQAWRIAEWFIQSLPWLVVIAGNHDMWSGGGSPLRFIQRQVGIESDWAARFRLRWPNGAAYTVDARHDHPGHSQWNALHAQRKAALFSAGADLYIAGHRHNWALAQMEEQGRTVTLARARGYKFHDEYCLIKGFAEQTQGQSIMTVLEPLNSGEVACHAFVDPVQGAQFLTWLRSR